MLKVIKVTVIMKEEKRRDKSSRESGVSGSNAPDTRTYLHTIHFPTLIQLVHTRCFS